MKFTAIVALLGVVSSLRVNTELHDMESQVKVMAQLDNMDSKLDPKSKKVIKKKVHTYVKANSPGCSETGNFNETEEKELRTWVKGQWSKVEEKKSYKYAQKEAHNACLKLKVQADFDGSSLQATCITGYGDLNEKKAAFNKAYSELSKAEKRLARGQAKTLCDQAHEKALQWSANFSKKLLKAMNKARKDGYYASLPALQWSNDGHLAGFDYLVRGMRWDMKREESRNGTTQEGGFDKGRELIPSGASARNDFPIATGSETDEELVEYFLDGWRVYTATWRYYIGTGRSHVALAVMKGNDDVSWAYSHTVKFGFF